MGNLSKLTEKILETHKKRNSPRGKFRILCIDKFSDEDFVYREYDTAKQALKEAREKTREAMKYASDGSIATVFYAYTPDGRYLGGDVWNNE